MDRKRILLIDDEVTFARTLQAYLEASGRYEVRTANSGRVGISLAKEWRPDLILLDIIMPDIDGGQVAGEFAADPRMKDVPIIFLTAVVSREEATTHSGVIGGQLFIAKPVSGKEVLGHIERCLGNAAASVPQPPR
jgi:CheY-like chemotaxis protein